MQIIPPCPRAGARHCLRAALRRIPEPLRFVFGHGALGMAIGAAAAVGLILADLGGIGGLLARAPAGTLLGGALVVLFASTCGGAQIAFAIGLMTAQTAEGTGATRAVARPPQAVPARSRVVPAKLRVR